MFDLTSLPRERIAHHCVCCGSSALLSAPAILMPFVAHRVFGWEPVLIDESWGLQTIRQGNAYAVCKSLHCTVCGLLFLDIRFSDQEMSRLYHDYRGEEYTSLRERYEPGYTQRNDNLNAGITYREDIEQFLAPFLHEPLHVLDWGGDTGRNTPFQHRAEVWDIYDISDKAVLPGARRVDPAQLGDRKYSLIVCSNVLEHIPYPADVLGDIRRHMDSQSVLYIEVPLEDVVRCNADNLHRHKKHWHEHINFYTAPSLTKLVENLGLRVLSLRPLQAANAGRTGHWWQMACALDS
ncbi:class I SAM-dependent methyltransferase [Candidatus Symbiobacter mobilis]|uniref:Uncharacterized protein n=1 Tax=Candidatus Symbiobacter mobilis CR TaxID=946483 RepID=U5NAS3_9BURK|nr:class I SAM-dependent methyltransferase [Candidatus Symbiobacter mobilis]AGX87299.1 hypothetical protein Cenrod_1207 [Candidatus Symbiobacter mobilis CR]